MKSILTVTLFVMFVLFGCSKDNPVAPVVPAYVGSYHGQTAVADSVSFTISNISGTAYVTSYILSYHYSSGGSSGSGTYEASNTAGIVQISGSTFEISLSSDPDEKITGTFSSETALGGTYKINPYDSYITGTFSALK